MIPIDLSGKTAIVTGGGQGLGAEFCTTLQKTGANVVINYFSDDADVNQKRAEKLSETLGEKTVAIAADVRDAEQINLMFEKTIELFGGIDILVNNAGIIRDRSVKKMSQEEWNDVLNTNLTGVFNVCKHAAEKLSEGGKIVNISSISGIIGFFGQANYAASKAGVIAFTKVLSKELAQRNITVNAVAPGVVLTEMGLTIPAEIRSDMLKSIPLGRFGEPREIANVVLFLCSKFSSYVTGQVIHVNGGWI